MTITMTRGSGQENAAESQWQEHSGCEIVPDDLQLRAQERGRWVQPQAIAIEEEDDGRETYAVAAEGIGALDLPACCVSEHHGFWATLGMMRAKRRAACLAASRGGQQALLGHGKTVLIVRPDEAAECFRAHEARVTSVALTPDNRSALSGDEDGNLLWWEAASRRVIARRRAHCGPVRALAIAPGSNLAASGAADGITRLWKLGSAFQEAPLERTCWREEVTAVAFSDDSQRLLAGGSTGRVDLWAMDGGTMLRRFDGAEGPIGCLRCTGDIVTATIVPADGQVLGHPTFGHWHLGTGRPRLSLDQLAKPRCIPGGATLDIMESASWSRAAIQARSSAAMFRRIRARAIVLDLLSDVQDGIRDFFGFRDSRAKLVNGLRARPAYALEVWSLTSGIRLHAFGAVGGAIEHLAVSPDNTHILAALSTGHVQVFAMPLA